MTSVEPSPFDDYVTPDGEHEQQAAPEQVEGLTADKVQPLLPKEIG